MLSGFKCRNMKKLVMFAIILLINHASYAGTTSHTYTFNDPVVRNAGGFQCIDFENTTLTGLPGEPILPYHKVNLLLPPGEEIVGLEFEWKDETVMQGEYIIYPQQAVRSLSDKKGGDFIQNLELYSKNMKYPENGAGKWITSVLYGHSLALGTFTPVRYNPATRQVSYFKKVTVIVHSRPGGNVSEIQSNFRSSAGINSTLQALIDNEETLKEYPSKGSPLTGEYEILIVTTSAFSNSFNTLIDLYKKEGLKCEVITKEAISATGTGIDIQDKIRNYIISEYQQHGIEYVLLGGDDELIPHRGLYCAVQSDQLWQDYDIPSDIYYAALDGNWNTDGDNKWGEPGEDDILPELSIGRLPFSSLQELNSMIHKSISYQETPVQNEMRKIMMAGDIVWYDPYTTGSQYLELIIGTHDDNGYTTSGIPENFTFDRMYEEQGPSGGQALINHINQGTIILNHCGHGNYESVMGLTISDITDANFSQVNGITHNYPVIYSHACFWSGFDQNDCIAEEMLKINNLASAVVGNSRMGWYNEGQTEGPSAHLHREFTDALYSDKFQRIGRAHLESKLASAAWVTAPGQWEPGALRCDFYCNNVLGDPCMALWTDNPYTPSVSYTASIPTGIASMPVNVKFNSLPLQGINCSVIKDNQVVGKGTTDDFGNAVITFNPPVASTGNAHLFVSGNNSLLTTFPLSFITATGSYVLYQSNQVNDASGNQNGVPDYGEAVSLSLNLLNAGLSNASNVSVTITSSDPFITITDATEVYPAIDAGASVSIFDGFGFSVADNIPDNHTIDFQINANSGTTVTSYLTLCAYAPKLVGGELSISEISGNNNGNADPGETVTLSMAVCNNGHSIANNAYCTLSSGSQYVTITNPTVNFNSLIPGQCEIASFAVTFSPSTTPGTNVEFSLTLITGDYSTTIPYIVVVGRVEEDFETGDFSKFEWQTSGNDPWFITNTGTYEGESSARSVDKTNLSHWISTLWISMDVIEDDSITFFYRVSCDDGGAFLTFNIDEWAPSEWWTGEVPWTRKAYQVPAGARTFTWKYEQYPYYLSGCNCGMLDMITFPACALITDVESVVPESLQLNLYPNPASSTLHIKAGFSDHADVLIRIVSAEGKIMWSRKMYLPNGALDETINDISFLSPGMYACSVQTGNNRMSRVFIVQ
jgi:hypothetical protein